MLLSASLMVPELSAVTAFVRNGNEIWSRTVIFAQAAQVFWDLCMANGVRVWRRCGRMVQAATCISGFESMSMEAEMIIVSVLTINFTDCHEVL